jgi:hypothetical protein
MKGYTKDKMLFYNLLFSLELFNESNVLLLSIFLRSTYLFTNKLILLHAHAKTSYQLTLNLGPGIELVTTLDIKSGLGYIQFDFNTFFQ